MRLGIFLFALTFAASGSAQTIQLPSFTSFSVDTTVLVPDSGRAATAGTKRASSASSNFGGFPKQRAAGVNRQAAGMSVLAKIHDPFEVDTAFLQQAAARHATANDDGAAARTAPAPPSGGARLAGDPGLRSVAEIERQRTNKSVAQQHEAFALYEKGRQAQAVGKAGVAIVFFRSASHRATGTLKQEIDADLKALNASAAPGKLSKTAQAAK
ncbi:MAG TPA: hypothetical protein VGZ26_01290 [Pirellulales bacterium]|jgi:hypothetical protein|nr:hypothetical protein [Pirellulales bacterium]